MALGGLPGYGAASREAPRVDDMTSIAGRQIELEAVDTFLSTLATGPAFLVLEGPAGIGKSTIWEAARSRAGESTVLTARPSLAEQEIPWAGLNDLLAPIDLDALDVALPAPQQRALDIVLARREPQADAVDELVISLAVQRLILGMSRERPILLAVDDLQWLDAPSRGVMAFVLRRAGDARVGLLATQRTQPAAGLSREPARRSADGTTDPILDSLRDRTGSRLAVGPLPDDAIGSIVRNRLDVPVPRPVLHEICQISGGNPLYAIELARSATDDAAASSKVVLAGVGDVEDLVRERLAGMAFEAADLMLAVAASRRLSWDQAAEVVGPDSAERGLDAAQRAGFLVTRAGNVEFTHPLLAAIVYGESSEPRKKRIHRRLAELWPDSEEAPRHLGLAATGPDAAIATRLDDAAQRARLRGAPAIAAALYDDAARLTPAVDRDDRDRRRVAAAMASYAAGETPRARQALETVAADLDGPRRAEALQQLAQVVWAADGDRAGKDAFDRALEAAAGNPAIEGDIHDNLAWLVCWLGDMPSAYEHVQLARDTAERIGDPALLARVYDKYGQIEFQIGRDPGLTSAARAMEYERAVGGGVGEAALNETIILTWSDRLDDARQRLDGYLARATDDGDERLKVECDQRLGMVELRAGNWKLAREQLDASLEEGLAAGLGTAGIRRTLAMLDAHEGLLDAARATVAESLPGARREGAAWAIIRYLGIEGFVELSLGNYQRAAEVLDEADQICEQIGVAEPGIFRTQADTVEALIGAGRLARAEVVLSRFERQSEAVQRPWGLATAARGRALLLASTGEAGRASEAILEALGRSAVLGQPFEHGRTLLVAGTIDRRAGRRREARARLTEAIEVLEDLGAAGWAARAREELGRISGRGPGGNELTAAERQVAALVAEGLTNGEVAARLFVTVRTVETNLTRIYQKLGVRSRTELSRRMAERSGELDSVVAAPD
jgi:DNA-binding CsgD family transcriptional regulator